MSRRGRWIAVSLLLIVVAVGLMFLPAREMTSRVLTWIELHRTVSWAVFIVSYVGASIVLIPSLPFTLAAGFVFGLPFGVALTSIGSTLGACAAFLVGRNLTREWVARRVAAHAGFRALAAATRHDGFKIVFLARMSPIFPFNLLNYGLALTAVRFRDYALASWLGMLPVTVLYVYIGTALGSFDDLMGGTIDRGGAGRVLLLGGLAATALLVVVIARGATRALGTRIQRELSASEPEE
jgi:uncharacterized membrane protein YdjX (TVP38/TMEM64 family)